MDTKVLSSGIRYTNLPESYVRPESERPNLSEVSECENVPVIGLACDDRSVIVQQVAYACKNYGFFQVSRVINHELPLEAVERVLEVAKEFFNLPVEEKLKLYSDDPSKTMRLSTSFNVNKEKVHNWRDYLRLHCYPLHNYVSEWPSDPPTFKTINDMMYSYLPDHTLDIPESEFMCNFVHKVVKRWGSLPIRGFNQETITSKLKTNSPQVLYGLASKLIKKPKKLELLQDKYGLGVRSTAFRSQPSSGEQSSPGGGGGEDHIIEGCYLGHESFATVGSSDLASPALNNTPSASDQSVGASALPQNRDGDEQPPPDRSLSDMEVGSSDLASPALNNTPSASDQSVGASALPQNRDGDEQPPPDRSLSDMERGVAPPAERQLNPSSVAQICLPLSCGVCIAPLQIWYAGTSLTPNAKILLLFVEIFGVAGLLLSFGAYWFQRKRKTSGVMTVMGCVFTICGFLSILGTRFPEKAMIWLTAALWTLPIVASPFALKELV